MARVTPQQAAEKYRQRTAVATSDWVNGINRVQTSPGQAAAAAKDKWAQNTAAAKDRFATNAAKVDVNAWKAAATAKQSRYQQGTDVGAGKMQTFMAAFLPAQDQVTSAVRGMPSTTPEQREQRAIAQMRGTRALKGQFKQ